jgi:flagellin-like hook-associated protein FlgL
MSISPVNFSRISQNMRSALLSDSIRRSSLELFLTQSRIATGRSFVAPSEDPVAAARVMDLSDALGRQRQFAANVRFADDLLAAADGSMTEISGLLSEAQTIASQDVSNLTSAEERAADAELIAAIRRQLVSVGNRSFNGKYLFAGRDTLEAPFVDVAGGIQYLGDTGDLVTRIDTGASDPMNVPGNVLFGALSAHAGGATDLTPRMATSVRIEDLTGAAGVGVRPGTLLIHEIGGAGAFTVDLRHADTIGAVVESINAAAMSAGAGVRAELSDAGIDIVPAGSPITIGEIGIGGLASDLGLQTSIPTTDRIVGGNLRPRVSPLTSLDDLRLGAGIDMDGGLILTNGSRSALVDLSGATTVQDVLNAIHNAGAHVTARVNAAGNGLEVVNHVSGTALTIAENGGTTAEDLGLRTLFEQAPLSRLNFGRGVHLDPNGSDLRISASDGSTLDVDLDGARTIGDVVSAINEAATSAGVPLTASLATTGNGIRLEDGTAGGGVLSVVSLGESTAALDLGFVAAAATGVDELISEDRSGVRAEGVLGALIDLETALRRDDDQGITLAAERVETALRDLTRIHGLAGARSQGMRAKLGQMEDAAQTTEVFLSQVRDLDYAEAATQLQGLQTQFQAALQTSSTLLTLSLMDFLR